MYGKFTPKPRDVVTEEHQLNDIAEEVFKQRQMLNMKNYAQPGSTPSEAFIPVNGNQLRVPYIATVLSHQIGIPFDHSSFPPIKKLPTVFPACDYVVMWGAAPKVKWVQDESYWHIPTFSRYVINNTNQIRNAHNGIVLTDDILEDNIQLVRDGRANKPSFVNSFTVVALANMKLGQDFVDFGYGQYTHRLEVDAVEGLPKWTANPDISVRNDVTAAVKVYPGLQMFLHTQIKDFDARNQAKAEYKNMKADGTITVADKSGTYTVKKGRVETPAEFGPTGTHSEGTDFVL